MNLLKHYISLALNENDSSLDEGFNFSKFKKIDDNQSMLTYANLNLQEIGEGSSRKVYIFSGTKVLKVATCEAGLAQNETEVSIFTDPETAPIVAKIFDMDRHYFWLTSELTRPLRTTVQFEKLAGLREKGQLDIDEFTFAASRGMFEFIESKYDEVRVMNFARSIHALVRKYGLLAGDLGKVDSWGVTPDGRLVLIDYGFSQTVKNRYY
jgi:hypothetical protein